MPDIFDSIPTQKKGGDIFEQIDPQTNESFESLGKTILRSGYQPISGYLKKFTYPADILQMAGVGEALDPEFIEQLREIHEREGIPFDEDKYRQKVAEASQAFPTQSNIEKFIEEKTDLPLQAETEYQKLLNLAGTAGGFQPGSLTQKATAAVAAPAISASAQKLGLPEPIADILGLGGASGIAGAKIVERPMNPEQRALRNIAEKHELPTYAGMEVEGTPKVSPVISKAKHEKLSEELKESSKKAIDKVISEQLPLKNAEKLGVNPESVYERAYQRMDETAKNVDKKMRRGNIPLINVEPVLRWINGEISILKNSAPSLSAPDKVRLRILEQEYNQLTNSPPKSFVPKLKLGPARERTAKEINASQAIDQTRNYNENVKGIYRKAEFTGAENEVREVYGQLNNQFKELLEKSGETELAGQLWFANQVFHETSKVNQVNSILFPALEDGYNASKMSKVLKNKNNRKFLERSLGKNSVKDMIDIAHYGNKAEKLVMDRLKNPKTVGEYLSELTPLKAGLLLFKHGATAGLGTAYEIGKGTLQRAAGSLFTRSGTRKSYKNFLKSAGSSKGSFIKAAKEFTNKINEEFGSEENLLELSTQKEK